MAAIVIPFWPVQPWGGSAKSVLRHFGFQRTGGLRFANLLCDLDCDWPLGKATSDLQNMSSPRSGNNSLAKFGKSEV
jgi:hypothetical protein